LRLDSQAVIVLPIGGVGNKRLGGLVKRASSSRRVGLHSCHWPTKGSDANKGTQSKPFKTLARALSKAQAGDTIRLAAGLYTDKYVARCDQSLRQ
jgi:hypothetical protein